MMSMSMMQWVGLTVDSQNMDIGAVVVEGLEFYGIRVLLPAKHLASSWTGSAVSDFPWMMERVLLCQ